MTQTPNVSKQELCFLMTLQICAQIVVQSDIQGCPYIRRSPRIYMVTRGSQGLLDNVCISMDSWISMEPGDIHGYSCNTDGHTLIIRVQLGISMDIHVYLWISIDIHIAPELSRGRGPLVNGGRSLKNPPIFKATCLLTYALHLGSC